VPDRARAVAEAGAAARAALTAIEDRLGKGSCPIVTGGGTGSLQLDVGEGAWNELQPGSYAFSDADYARNLASDGIPDGGRVWKHSLFLACTVMSRTGDPGEAPEESGAAGGLVALVGGDGDGGRRRPSGRVVLDVGLKATSADSGPPVVWSVRGWGPLDPRLGALQSGQVQLSDEHCQLFAPAMGEEEEAVARAKGGEAAVEEAVLAGLPEVGQVIWMVPGHVDPTFNHHDHVILVNKKEAGTGAAAGAGAGAGAGDETDGGAGHEQTRDGTVMWSVEQVVEVDARSPGY